MACISRAFGRGAIRRSGATRSRRSTFGRNSTFRTEYANGFAGHVLSVEENGVPIASGRAITAERGVPVDLEAFAVNIGTSRWYGYDTGLYFGQTQVRIRLYTTDGKEVSEGYLYIPGSSVHDESKVSVC